MDWKDKLAIVYSTNPDFNPKSQEKAEPETLDKGRQPLRIFIDKHHRKGKVVTFITGFEGKDDDLQQLARFLKTQCGTGGSAKDGEILIQGDFRQKILTLLHTKGYEKARVI
jgi:translation initiation factor 1